MNAALVASLEIIAAKAKQLAQDVEQGRLWPGDLTRGLHEIKEQLSRAEREGNDHA